MAKQEVHGIEISIRRGFGPWLLATALMMAAAPVAAVDLELDDDEFTGNEDETIVRNVLTNDSDDDGFPFFVAENTDPGNGTVTFDASGTMTYTPVDGFSGVDIFDYTVRSLDPACFFGGPPECTATATVVLTVRADADLPLLSASNATGDEDSAITLTLSAASNDPDGSEELRAFIGNLSPGTVLSAGSPVGPSTWEVPIAVLGGLTVTPPPNTNGVVTLNFSVLATDSAFDLDGDLINEDSTNANVSFQVSVAPVDDPPTIVGAIPAVLGSEDAELIVDLNPIFEDPDSPLSLSVGAVTNPAIETAIISGLQLRLRPFADANGTGSVEVIANAPDPGDSVSVNIAVDIDQVNDTPVVDEPLLNVDVDEDSGTISVSLADAFDDVDIDTNGDSLGFTVTSSDATLFSAIATSGTATELTLAENANGNALITVVAEDTEGATATQTFNVNVNPVNDAPFELLAIPSETVDEDDGTVSYLLTDHFDDVDILTNGDVLTFSIESNSAPELFAPAEVVGKLLELTPAPDANGVANIVVKADDGEASETISFTLTINAINDIPEANADAFTMAEDEPALVLDVLANDYLAEEPVVIVSAGTDGFSDSGTAFSYLNATGDIVEGPNGTVAIVDNSIVYQPKPNFYGEDTFSYVIRDESGAGDLSEPAVVTITVTPENDPPEGEAVKTYVMFANESISIPLDEGVTRDAYDLDYALIDPDTGDVVGGGYTAALVTLPSAGGTFSFATDGSFTYTPPADYTGVSTFTYRLQDAAISSEGEYEARIVVLEAPEAAVPPAPGEVAVPHNLASTPLEQAIGVTPNVLIMMDDSGSMDWDITTFSAGDEGVMRLDNGDIRSDGADRTTYHYVWQLPGNTYSATSNSGRSLPTEEALDGNTTTDDNEYGVWRARNSQFNVLYYDPSVRYDPWIGYDSSNTLYGPADPNAIRLDPADPTSTLDMLADFTYDADNVPQWDSDGGTEDLSVTVYIPRYYTTTATGLPEWNSPHTLVEIRDGAGPLAGGMFPGGSNRFDCAGDGDSSDCTYAEEIQNFANWLQYYRKREYVAKASVAAVLEDVD
ncbi:MAG: Ig-like domain-containing protein, partial [Pseudomonadota bacterium]